MQFRKTMQSWVSDHRAINPPILHRIIGVEQNIKAKATEMRAMLDADYAQ